MEIKLIAPFRTTFNIMYFNAMKDYQQYANFWLGVQEYYRDDPKIKFVHRFNETMVYENIADDGNNFSPEIINISNDPAIGKVITNLSTNMKEELKTYQILLDEDGKNTICHIYDNTVGIMETTIYIQNDFNLKDVQEWSDFVREIQAFSNDYMRQLIQQYYQMTIKGAFL